MKLSTKTQLASMVALMAGNLPSELTSRVMSPKYVQDSEERFNRLLAAERKRERRNAKRLKHESKE